MKGPFERLKYDMRRVWECPECHHKERTGGITTTVVCRCQAKKEPLDRVVMKLAGDRVQRRFPEFVPPTNEEYDMAASDDSADDEEAPSEVAVIVESESDKTIPAKGSSKA